MKKIYSNIERTVSGFLSCSGCKWCSQKQSQTSWTKSRIMRVMFCILSICKGNGVTVQPFMALLYSEMALVVRRKSEQRKPLEYPC